MKHPITCLARRAACNASTTGYQKFAAALLLVLTLPACSGQAATDSGSVLLSGTVAATVSITVVPQGSYNALDITTQTTVTDLTVATVSELSNVGYNVKVESANVKAGSRCATVTSPCLWASGTDNGIKTDLKINATSISLFGGEYQYKTGGIAASGTTPEDVDITYTIGQAYPAGTYTETLTFTITSI